MKYINDHWHYALGDIGINQCSSSVGSLQFESLSKSRGGEDFECNCSGTLAQPNTRMRISSEHAGAEVVNIYTKY